MILPKTGIGVLTGGGACSKIWILLQEETGLPVYVADDPLCYCVVRGSVCLWTLEPL